MGCRATRTDVEEPEEWDGEGVAEEDEGVAMDQWMGYTLAVTTR